MPYNLLFVANTVKYMCINQEKWLSRSKLG
jgi:hypothetical protein